MALFLLAACVWSQCSRPLIAAPSILRLLAAEAADLVAKQWKAQAKCLILGKEKGIRSERKESVSRKACSCLEYSAEQGWRWWGLPVDIGDLCPSIFHGLLLGDSPSVRA